MVVICYLLVIGSWSLRNYYTADYFGVSTVSAINLYRYDACTVLAKLNSISFAQQQNIIDLELKKLKTQKEIFQYCMNNTVLIFANHPILFTYLHIKDSLNAFLPSIGDLFESLGIKIGNKGTLSVINSNGIIAGIKYYFYGHYYFFLLSLPLVAILVLLYFFTVYGFFVVFKLSEKPTENLLPENSSTIILKIDHIFILILCLCFIFAGGGASTPRFRIPIEPFLCIYASVGLSYFF